MEQALLTAVYLIASVTFIIGLKMLSHPETARKGNLVAAAGMTLAIIGTIFLYQDKEGQRLHNYGWIFGGLMIGGVIGVLAAKKVKMTAMPEMVSMFNGMGGACAALISLIEFDHFLHEDFINKISDPNDTSVLAAGLPLSYGTMITIFLGLIIGSVSFAGSMIAWGKLNGKVKDWSFKGQHIVNLIVLALVLGISIFLISTIHNSYEINDGFLTNPVDDVSIKAPLISIHTSVYVLFYLVFFLSLVYGVLFVFPIGGADMPVVISLLNSFTGVAAACGGFLYGNKVMLTGGILVGAAGTLLTILMCKAMNRSLGNVLIGSFGGSKAGSAGGTKDQGSHKEITISDAAVVMAYANKVMIVPGSQQVAEQVKKEGLDKIFEAAGFEVRQAGCSACLGMNEDKIPAGEYCISTSNRNFEGRQGAGARTLLASPLTAAASAITGVVTDVRDLK